jgi:DNA-binding beta-propeller fold protein YncE
MKKLACIALAAGAAAFAAEGYKVLDKIKIGGPNGWDYVVADGANHRLYVSHGTSIEIVDTKDNKVIGSIGGQQGVHGIAIAPELNKGFISNGRANKVTVFDLKTLKQTGETGETGRNPDAICYEPKTKRVFTFDHTGNSATAIDANTNAIIKTFPIGDAPEYCAADGNGKMYANLEGSSEVIEIDAAGPDVTRRVTIEPGCKGPSGLAIDTKDKVLFSVCGDTKTMAITDYANMKVVGTVPIGAGPDAAGYDPGTGLAFSSNGRDATLTIVKKVNGKWEAVDTVATERGARTMAVDDKNHKVYLLAAEYPPPSEQPAQPAQGGRGGRGPQALPDSFHVLVVGK